MAWQLTVYTTVGLAAAAVSFLVAGLAVRDRSEPGIPAFAALMCALGGWSLVSGIQLGFSTLADQLAWHRVSIILGATIPVLWLLFTLDYAGKRAWRTPRRIALLAIAPAGYGLLGLTNGSHGLVWEDATLATVGSASVAQLSLGWGYYAFAVVAYVYIGGGLLLLLGVMSRSSALYRRQAGSLILGTLVPTAANIAYTLRLDVGPLPALDPTPFAFVVTGVLFSLALFRFDLLDRTPVARQQVLDEMGDGFVVLDQDDTVIDSSPVAGRVLDPPPAVGDSIHRSLPMERDSDSLAALDRTTITPTVDGRQRAYDLQVSSLTDHHGRSVGTVLAVRDVTDRTAHERRLEVTQRVLRHNLRNDMNVIRGWAEHLADTSSGDQADAARRIIETTDTLVDLTDKTRKMVALSEIETTEEKRRPIDGTLREVVESARREHPAAKIESFVPNDLTLTLPDEELLRIAVRNLVENAVEHSSTSNLTQSDDAVEHSSTNNRTESDDAVEHGPTSNRTESDDTVKHADTAHPRVAVRARRTDGEVRITVADDGPGLPPNEQGVLEGRPETKLDHGTGMGLWLVRASVTVAGGEVDYAEGDTGGSEITFSFPRPETDTKGDPRSSSGPR